jgi:putative tryptophan/tyrosine transport system substrate-binding protein
MTRREFLSLLGGAALAWPLAAEAQQPERMRRIGVLMNRAATDPEGQSRLAAFQQGLQQAGWSVGRNVRIDTRWGEDDLDLEAKYAAELIALAPDIIFAVGTLSVAALQRLSRTVPIVFVGVTDPLGAGFVNSLARPGGNATGFMIYEYSLSGKWLELLKEIAPGVMRVAILRNPDNPVGVALFGAIQAEARSLRIEVIPVDTAVTPARLNQPFGTLPVLRMAA